MRHALLRPGRAGRLAVTAALAGAFLGACRPGAEGGYDKVSFRRAPTPPQASHPVPPPPNPALLAAPAGQQVVLRSPPAGVTQAMVDEGQKLYGTVCVACHGAGGTGSAAAPALNDAEWLNISGQYPEIVAIINSGVSAPKQYPGAMPPKGGGAFTDEQVGQIGAYVYALSHQGAQ